MEIKHVDKHSINDYIRFCKSIYKNNIYYRDTMSIVVKSILNGRAEICKSSITVPIMVIENGKILAICIFAIVDRMKDTLQITHFEALEGQEKAVDMLLEYGKGLALKHGIKIVSAGFNLHVNYVLGILANKYDEMQSFGNAYNPSYYIDYFRRYNPQEISFVNYLTDLNNFTLNMNERIIERITSKYHVRKADFKNMKREAEIYTRVNNEAFKNHKFYYERRINEDLELFNDFKFFLKEENLLFLEHNDKTIGFMLWYPDFNQLMDKGETLGIKTFIKNKLFSDRINKFKLVELGIIPEYQKSGAVLALFHKCWQLIKDRYEFCETGWILEDNISSKNLCFRWADKEYKQYKIFLINI